MKDLLSDESQNPLLSETSKANESPEKFVRKDTSNSSSFLQLKKHPAPKSKYFLEDSASESIVGKRVLKSNQNVNPDSFKLLSSI